MDQFAWEVVFLLLAGVVALIRGPSLPVGMLVSLLLGPSGWLLIFSNQAEAAVRPSYRSLGGSPERTLVGVSGLEPETSALSGQCSNQLS